VDGQPGEGDHRGVGADEYLLQKVIHREAGAGVVFVLTPGLGELPAPEPIAASRGIEVVFEEMSLDVEHEL